MSERDKQTKNFNSAYLSTVVVLTVFVAVVGCCQMNMQTGLSAPSSDAIVLFDCTDFAHWTDKNGGPVQWQLVDGAMKVVPGKGSIITKQKFQDIKLHVEFNIPQESQKKKDQSQGNSGIYIQRRYEVQILDSYGHEPKYNGCGAIYRTKPPDRNVCKRAGEWQSYDITFHAARFEGEGEHLRKVKNARITVIHNGVMIHNNFEIPNKTGKGNPEGPQPGHILLQDHGSEVQFRNIWLVAFD